MDYPLTQIGTEIEKAAFHLVQGEVIAIPTETVYGLAGNGLNPDAVLKIFETKQRPHFNPLILHVGSVEQIKKYVKEIPPLASLLMQRFMPGPLTLLLSKSASVPDLVTAGSERVAIRVPAHPLTIELLNSLDFPLAAPSANPFGYISPTTAQHVMAQLGGKIPYILDGGPCEVGIESTIAAVEGEDVVIYRHGGITAEDIAEELGVNVRVRSGHSENPEAPGMLKSHYAPKKKLHFGNADSINKNSAFAICFSKHLEGIPPSHTFILSPTGDLREAAHNLFAALRKADASDCTEIYAEPLPEAGLGIAINDRLRRAGA